MPSRTVDFTWPGRPALLNRERSEHWREHRATTKDVRTAAMLTLGREGKKGQMRWVKVTVQSFYADARLPDTGACLPAVKAVIDGAVDARLLPNDKPETVKYLGFMHPRTDKTVGNLMVVTFEELEEGSPWML